MKRVGLALLLVVVFACDGGTPLEPDPGDPSNCRLGPISPLLNWPQPCEPISPRCPRSRPATARTLWVMSSCLFGWDEGSCKPVASCPSSTEGLMHLSLRRPPGSQCRLGDLYLAIQPSEGGSVRITWHAQEMSDAPEGGCRHVGPEYEGAAKVDGPCCEATVDLPFPNARRTVRMVFRTDWQP
jgi:hypothetical protein